MNFESIFKKLHDFFPKQIDIADGQLTEGDGFYSKNLSSVWYEAVSKVNSHAEGYFVWSVYRILHKNLKKQFKRGVTILDLNKINKDEFRKDYFQAISEAESIIRKKFCCKEMSLQFQNNCETHDSRYDCPDTLIDLIEEENEFRIFIHDGGTSGIAISYCPWCGNKLK